MSDYETDELAELDDDTQASPLGLFGAMQTMAFGPDVAAHQQKIAERARQLAAAEHGRQLALIELAAQEDQRIHAHRAEMRRHARQRSRGVAWQAMVTPVALGAIASEVATLLAMFGWRVFG